MLVIGKEGGLISVYGVPCLGKTRTFDGSPFGLLGGFLSLPMYYYYYQNTYVLTSVLTTYQSTEFIT